MKLVLHGAVGLAAALYACGAVTRPKPAGVAQAPLDDSAGAPEWDGGCITLASRSAPIDVKNAVLDGDLYRGRHHCYFDLQRALCVRYPGDGGLDEVDVRALRLGGECDKEPEARFRGKLHGPLEPIERRGSAIAWAVDAQASSLERASREVDVDVDDPSAARMDLLKSFVFRCWREGTAASPTTSGHLALRVTVSPSGAVTDVQRRDAVGVSSAIEQCVAQSVRAPQMFVATGAAADRELALRITFSLAVLPLDADAAAP